MRVVKLHVAATIVLALGTVRLSAQEVVRPGRDPQFLSQPSFGIYDAVTNKLVKDRTRYSFKNFSNYELFPHSQSLHQGDKAWKSHFSEIVTPRPISGRCLSLVGTGAAAGDVVLLEGSGASKPLVLVYIGENRFRDNSKQFSFFVFPYSARGGLELNTMPPRFHRKLLEQYELLKPADDPKFKFTTATEQHGLTIDWLKSPRIVGSHFLQSNWWKQGGHYRVLRASPDIRLLARTILDSDRISLMNTHTSNEEDKATAFQNIADTADGKSAGRSSYQNAPGGSVTLSKQPLTALLQLSQTYTFRVTEMAGGSHSSDSRHYLGVAFDVDQIIGERVSAKHPEVQNFMRLCREFGATEVLGPGDKDHDTHIHAAWPRPSN